MSIKGYNEMTAEQRLAWRAGHAAGQAAVAERVRACLMRGDVDGAWKAVRTLDQAIAETECPACRQMLAAGPTL